MPLTEFQQEYLRNCDHRWNVKTGATRSGKTYLDCAVTIPKRICAARGEGLAGHAGQHPRHTGTQRTGAHARPLGAGACGRRPHLGLRKHRAALRPQGLCPRCRQQKHIARIQGAAFEYAYGDEITTWDEGVFQMLKSRLSCPHSHFDGTCNPESPSHWFKNFLTATRTSTARRTPSTTIRLSRPSSWPT